VDFRNSPLLCRIRLLIYSLAAVFLNFLVSVPDFGAESGVTRGRTATVLCVNDQHTVNRFEISYIDCAAFRH